MINAQASLPEIVPKFSNSSFKQRFQSTEVYQGAKKVIKKAKIYYQKKFLTMI